MKKTILTAMFIIFCINSFAHETDKEWREKFINLSFTKATLSQDNVRNLKSNYGAGFSVGRTYFLHKPICNMLRFGIDTTWLDINYTNYNIKHITFWETNTYHHHQGEISMHIGPSITLEPFKGFTLHGYFHYAPTFAAIYTGNNNAFYGNYASIWTTGSNVSYGVIGFGIEGRFGNLIYRPFKSADSDSFRARLSGLRAYLTFKF